MYLRRERGEKGYWGRKGESVVNNVGGDGVVGSVVGRVGTERESSVLTSGPDRSRRVRAKASGFSQRQLESKERRSRWRGTSWTG